MRRSAGIRLLVAGALVAIGAVVFATVGSPARSETIPSKVTITYSTDSDSFSGTVKAKRAGCRARRTVTVFEREEGRRDGPKKRGKRSGSRDTVVGSSSTSSERSGTWGPVPNTGGSGRFYARVSGSTASGYGSRTRCSAAKSKTIRVP